MKPTAAFAFVLALAFSARAETPDEFLETRVRPLLAAKCQACHAGTKTRGGLSLDSRDAVLRGGDTGPAAVPGDPAKSLLIAAVKRTGDLKMPEDKPLSSAEVAVLEKWVELKLPWPAGAVKAKPAAELWATKPVIDRPPPMVRESKWPANPLDRFILAKLEAAKLAPAPAADPRTLVRRVAFDLTGLPPTPEAVNAFAADPSPTAYAKLIDAYLASPAYGERWGRHWLDLVRYCDSFDARGVGGDGDCADAWRYRDWVISAFNADLPYDQFVRMQLAGDVLPGVDRAAGITATGMLALGNWGGGDADKEKLLTDIVDDQIDVVSRTILGLTVACARCHDHKFDPIPTKDYYALAGIFFSTHILPDVGAKTGGPNMLRIPVEPPAAAARRVAYAVEMANLDVKLLAATAAARAAAVVRLKRDLPRHLAAVARTTTDPTLDAALLKACRDGLRPAGGAGTLFTKYARNVAGNAALHGWAGPAPNPSAAANTSAEAVSFSTIVMPPRSVAVHPGPASDVAVAWTSPVSGDITVTGRVRDFDATCGDGVTWELRRGGAVLATGNVANGGSAPLGKEPIAATVAAGERVELVIQRRAGYECDTTGVEFTVRNAGTTWDFVPDWLAGLPAGPAKVGPWTIEEPQAASAVPEPVRKALAAWRTAPTAATADSLATAVVAADGVPILSAKGDFDAFVPADIRANLTTLRAEHATKKAAAPGPPPTANGAREGGTPGSPHAGFHDVKVHVRGRYDRLGDAAPRGFPGAVTVANPPKISAGSGRAELADWVTRPDHPLTARVIVNRVWQYHFGEGLVRTPSNFGTLGEAPANPELLDHLAAKFVREKWSLKDLHRYLLLSATYRQSAANPATRAADPDNKLWGRFPRRRLESEAVRDSLLAVSGDLDSAMTGPAVRDADGRRRTLYQITIRSDRTGFGPLFDVADSTSPVDKRTVSTVAPQALYLMNHPFMLARAKAFAARVQARPGATADKLKYAHELAFGRPPTPPELALGETFLAAGGDWPGWCHLLFQANEFVVVE